MKDRLVTLAGALVLVAVIGKDYAVPAIAQAARAALVKNLDEKGRIPYQANSSCAPSFLSPNSCTALFPVVPAGRRLVIESTNAEFLKIGSDPAAGVTISTGDSFTVPSFFRYSTNYGVNSPVLIYVEAGQQAGFTAFGTVLQAHITGYLVDLTQ